MENQGGTWNFFLTLICVDDHQDPGATVCFGGPYTPWWLRGYSVCLECGRPRFNPWVEKFPWRRKWQPTPVFFPGESHGGRILVGYSPWGRKESDTTECFHFHFHTPTGETECSLMKRRVDK